jgi:hypothetical protein
MNSCTPPCWELSKDTKNTIWSILFGGSHNYKTKQSKLQGHNVTHLACLFVLFFFANPMGPMIWPLLSNTFLIWIAPTF